MPRPGKSREIIEPATGLTWPSVAALSSETGWAFATIKRHAETGKPFKGRVFWFVADGPPVKTHSVEDLLAENSRLRNDLFAAEAKLSVWPHSSQFARNVALAEENSQLRRELAAWKEAFKCST